MLASKSSLLAILAFSSTAALGFPSNFGSRILRRNMCNVACSGHELAMDAFAVRQFNNPQYTGTQITYDTKEFEKRVNDYYKDGYSLVDGYAPFW
jgi:hypothetical protein